MKGPHTSLWVMFAQGREYDVKEAVKKAPRKVLEKMLEQMMSEGANPVWDGLVLERGYPAGYAPNEARGFHVPRLDIAPLANGDTLDLTLTPIITDN